MTDKQIIIEDCPYFIGGNCQEYLDGVCENHKCDLKIIRELEEKLSNKRKECDELHETVKSQKEEIKNLNYTLYEERNLTTDLAKANLKISALERDLSSVRNRFKNENQQNKEIIKAKEQECEKLNNIINEAKNSKLDLNSFFAIEATVGEYQLELDQLKAEVKSKTEYIQEQRDIINQYSKEIEMYKKCQGKRASKREEELKAENDELKRQHEADKGLITSTGKMNYQLIQEYDKLKTENKRFKETLDELFKIQYKLADNNKKLRQCITEIKELCQKHIKAEKIVMANDILQKISEVE